MYNAIKLCIHLHVYQMNQWPWLHIIIIVTSFILSWFPSSYSIDHILLPSPSILFHSLKYTPIIHHHVQHCFLLLCAKFHHHPTAHSLAINLQTSKVTNIQSFPTFTHHFHLKFNHCNSAACHSHISIYVYLAYYKKLHFTSTTCHAAITWSYAALIIFLHSSNKRIMHKVPHLMRQSAQNTIKFIPHHMVIIS